MEREEDFWVSGWGSWFGWWEPGRVQRLERCECGENEPIVDEVLMQDFISWFGSIVHFLGTCMSGSCLEQVSGCKKLESQRSLFVS